MAGELALGLVAIAAVLLALRSRRSSLARAAQLEAERDALVAKLAGQGAELQKQTQARARLTDELTTLRNRIEKTRKRKTKASDRPLGTLARIRDHEARVERAEAERDRALAAGEMLRKAVAALEARVVAQTRALEEASARPAEAEEAVEANAGDSAARCPAEPSEHKETLGKLREELARARQTEARMRKRMSNQEQLYASLRAELEVKKDRLKTQEEQLRRLQALKVAIGG